MITTNDELHATTIMKRRKRLGKCARRRNQKARAIANASSAPGGVDDEREVENMMMMMTTTSGKTSTITPSSSMKVPSDRGYILEGVKVRRREGRSKYEGHCHHGNINAVAATAIYADDDDDNIVPLHPDDEHSLLSQLGYIPGNAVCVAARSSSSLTEDTTSSTSSSYNHHDSSLSEETTAQSQSSSLPLPPPLVLQLYPMAARQKYGGGKSDGRAYKGRRRGAMRLEASEEETVNDDIIIEPFPTLYWLTHPQLHTKISKLELSTEYNVSKMEERLRSSSLYLQQMERAHLSYGRKRWELLTLNDREYVMQCGWTSALDDSRGVAGIRLNKDDDEDDGNCKSNIIEDDTMDREDGTKVGATPTTTTKKKDGHRRSKGYDCVKCLHAHVAHYLAQISEWEDGLMKEEEAAQTKDNHRSVIGSVCACDDAVAEDGSKLSEKDNNMIATSRISTQTTTTTKKECDWNDLNLVGKWAMEVVTSWDSEPTAYQNNDN